MISIIIPTYNASKYLKRLLESLDQQTMKCEEIIIVDSSSADNTIDIAKLFDAKVIIISQQEFDHGGTRTKAGKIAKGDILVYLTQDAVPYDKYSIQTLVRPFYEDEKIGAVFGRQVPYPNATPFAKHLRVFNYPDRSYIRTIDDKEKYGLKTCFCSNSFSAYRKKVLEEIGWFKNGLILGEDSYAGAKVLLEGYKIAYVADSIVHHSHNYSIVQEFKRYFDIGVFHREESWLLQTFGRPEEEGLRYILSEFNFLCQKGYWYLLPTAILRVFAKFLGYKLGRYHCKMPMYLKKKFSLHFFWWDNRI